MIDFATAVQVVAVIGGVVWSVAKIRSTTGILASEIQHLSATIRDLSKAVSKIDEKTDTHEVRLAVVETKQGA